MKQILKKVRDFNEKDEMGGALQKRMTKANRVTPAHITAARKRIALAHKNNIEPSNYDLELIKKVVNKSSKRKTIKKEV